MNRNIIDLPIEIQENILVNIDTNTKLESVCLLWNEICKKNVIKNVRIPCVCTKSPHHAMVCNGMGHPCIYNGNLNYDLNCKSPNHININVY